MSEDKLFDAKAQGQAQFDSIREMVEALQAAEKTAWEHSPTSDGNYDEANEAARRAIEEDALSVEVRTGWYDPCNPSGESRRFMTDARPVAQPPTEYRILLCTGGPACQIAGQLNEHCEPETAVMQVQDWFQPWTEFRPDAAKDWNADLVAGRPPSAVGDAQEVMLAYARCFWFGE